MRARRLVTAAIAIATLTIACANNNDKENIPPVVLGMLDTTPATYDDGQVSMYEVKSPVELPIRQPKDGERPGGDVDPYPQAPFYLAKDTRITVRFTISNLEDRVIDTWMLVDGWNEFVRYVPGLVVGDEQTTPNRSGRELPFVLGPKQRVEGIITADDMVELATDLATGMKLQKTPPDGKGQFGGPVLYNRANDPQNRSSQPDIVLGPYIPQVVAGITGFDIGLRTYDKAAKIAVELVIEVEDVNGDRVIQDGDTSKQKMGQPGDTLSPPAPAPAM